MIHRQSGELALAENLFQKSLKLCAERGFALLEALITVRLGVLSALRGKAQSGLEQIRRSGARDQRVRFILALGYASAGKPDEAFAILEKALESTTRSGAELELASMHWLKGRLLEDRANSEQAENSFRTSIEIARRQNAKSLELRTTTSLARLLAKQGKRDEARALLADIYNWFTEGFDTADLKDAKALLNELGNHPSTS